MVLDGRLNVKYDFLRRNSTSTLSIAFEKSLFFAPEVALEFPGSFGF
jgi:hypothetical protein